MSLCESHKYVIDKIMAQLEWRGPTGKPMKHVVIARDEALAFLAFVALYPLTAAESINERINEEGPRNSDPSEAQ